MTRLAGRAGNWAARRRAQGRAGRAGRRRGAGLGVRGVLGWHAWRAAGRARGRGAVSGRRARGVRRQRAAGAQAGTAWTSRGARLGARCARGTAGLGVTWALDGCAGWASWASFGALCTWLSSGSIFGPGSTRYFPKSPNEYCSL